MRTHAHTHTSNSGSHSTQCSLHPQTQHTQALTTTQQSSSKPPTSTYTPRALQTHPGGLSQILALRIYHRSHTSWPPTWTPTATASHTQCADTHAYCHSHTHRLSHTHSLKTVMVSHMDTITHSEQGIFHTDTIYHCTSRNSEPLPIPSASHIPTKIHTQNSHSILGPGVA